MALEKKYLLGSDEDELNRLHFQHKVWSGEAFSLWERSGISLGQSVLDIGCGPGFTTTDLAGIVGPGGRVTGIDKIEGYVNYARRQAEHNEVHHVDYLQGNLHDIRLNPNSFDAVYSRWVLMWIPEPELVVQNIVPFIKKGGLFMFQEYLDWATLAVYPRKPEVDRVIGACRESWANMGSEVNMGPYLPEMLVSAGCRIEHLKALPKMGNSSSSIWQWPGTFLKIYSLKLIEYGLLTQSEREDFLAVWEKLERNPDAFLVGPLMMEIIARRT